MNLEALLSTTLDATVKGVPDMGGRSIALSDVPQMRWNLLAGDLPVPLATLDRARMQANSRWMRSFIERYGVKLCPHGKTTMAPQLFKMQRDDGAWGITVASTQQMQVCRGVGIQRILMANQLVGGQEMQAVFRAMHEDPALDFYCLVDSVENVRQLRDAAQRFALERPLQVLLEGGVRGGRTGCRNFDEAISLARLVAEAGPYLALGGVEGFEGVIDLPDRQRSEAGVGEFIEYLAALLDRSDELGLFAERKPLLTIGGSIYFDLVAMHPKVQCLRDRCEIVLRSGCYLTHDSRMLTENFRRIRERASDPGIAGEAFRPALNVWGRVQSLPEPGLAIVNVGKRDVSYDVHLPVVEKWFRHTSHSTAIDIPWPVTATQINDQHTFLKLPPGAELRVGDLIGLGVSHPCTTFDKWKLLYVIDERYDVVEGVLTFF